ncbi:MAG: hypothetical protein IJG84_08555 [Kiritimatiellae bacterium]|nr:hypothetical protein [Kiritimatiellia bacterium]
MKNLHASKAMAVCAVSVLLSTATAARDASRACAPQSRGETAWWIGRHSEKLAEIAARKDFNVVFLGDSIMHYWEGHKENWTKWMGGSGYNVLNLGFSGDKTENVMWRIANGELDGYRAKVFVLMIGTNNAGHLRELDEPASNVAAGVKSILDAIRERQPQAKVILCAILPRGKKEDFAGNVPWRNIEANVLIRRFCDGENVIWCDFGNQFLGARGTVDAHLLPDGLHPSDAGYDVFAASVLPLVDKILGMGGNPLRYDVRMNAQNGNPGDEQYDWRDGTRLWLEGKAFPNTLMPYDRLPPEAKDTVGKGVWELSRCPSGMVLRFRTDSRGFRIRWRVKNEPLDGLNISSCGKSGIDVYRYSPAGSRFIKAGLVASKAGSVDVPVWNSGMIDYLVNLPAYNQLLSVEVGFMKGARVEPPAMRASGVVKPVVFYGTSITQGASASRPGLGYVNLIGRQLDVPVVNMGFSGNGNMGGDMVDYIARIDASCYVIDTLWNMSEALVRDRYGKFVEALKSRRPGVPIVLVGMSNVYNRTPNPKDGIVKSIAEGLGLAFVSPAQLYVNDSEGSIDGCHPNDYGMICISRGIGAAVRKEMKLK